MPSVKSKQAVITSFFINKSSNGAEKDSFPRTQRKVKTYYRTSNKDVKIVKPPKKQGGATKDCNYCSRTFSTSTGRGVHERRAHKSQFHSAIEELEARKTRVKWGPEDISALISADLSISRPGMSATRRATLIFERGLGNKRSYEGIRRRLADVDYCRQRRKRALEEANSSGTESKGREEKCGNPIKEVGDPAAVLQCNGKLRESLLDKATEAHECKNVKILNRRFNKWLATFGTKGSKSDHGKTRKTPQLVGNRKKRRDFQRKAYLTAFEKNPARTSQRVIDDKPLIDEQSFPEGTFEFWKGLFETKSRPYAERDQGGQLEELDGLTIPFTVKEVSTFIARMKDGAPGLDGLRKRDLQGKSKPAELTEWMNAFMLMREIPLQLKRFRTTLIPKVEKALKPGEYRPISVGSIIRRLFTGLLAKRLNKICIDRCQRGFRKQEGVAIQSHTLRAIVDDAMNNGKSLSYVFVDVRKAFDSVSHEALKRAFHAVGLPQPLRELIHHMYRGNSTRLGMDPQQRVITLKRGVLQGDPLSPTLFNFVMHEVVDNLNSNIGAQLGDTTIPNLMFADDTVLFGETARDLQENLDKFSRAMSLYGLTLNEAKCKAVHIRHRRKTKAWFTAMKPVILSAGNRICNLNPTEGYRYLGLTTVMNRGQTTAVEVLRRGVDNISKSMLKPQQRMYALRTVLTPRLIHELCLERRTKELLKRMDRITKAAVKKWLHLPKDTPSSLIFASVRSGGLGISALRTLIPRLQYERFERLSCQKKKDKVLESFLGTAIHKADKGKILAQLEILGDKRGSWKLTEQQYWTNELKTKCDGIGLGHHGRVGYKSRWVREPGLIGLLSGKEYVQAIHVRLNSLPTRERRHRMGGHAGGPRKIKDSTDNRWCRQCHGQTGTLAHYSQNCGGTHTHRLKRHEQLCALICKKLRSQGKQVTWEPKIAIGNTFCKPDMVIFDKQKGEAFVLDPSIVTDGPGTELEDRAREKKVKYEIPAVQKFVEKLTGTTDIRTNGLIMDWRGAWADSSHQLLRYLGCSSAFIELLSFKVLKATHSIFRFVRNSPALD